MGKVVKYCAACEESFAEKFTFCPNCGSAMEAFEMNPLKNEAVREETLPIAANKAEEVLPVAANSVEEIAPIKPAMDGNAPVRSSVPASYEAFSNVESATSADTMTFSNAGETQAFANNFDSNDDDVKLEIFDAPENKHFAEAETPADLALEEPEETAEEILADEPETFAAATTAVGTNGNHDQYQTNNYRQATVTENNADDGGFHVTVIQEKNAKQRNTLLLGALVLMLTLTAGAMVYSIFNHPLLVGAIGEDLMLSVPVVTDEVPMKVEEQPKPKADKESGGGGGGGREEETPTSKGRLAQQMPDPPLISPTKTIVQKDFELVQPVATTVGTKKVKPTDEPYGDPNAKYVGALSDGMGKGGGQGSGTGTGQGSGKGLGQGSGDGSGSGSGKGDGNGRGEGVGDTSRGSNAPPPAPPARPVGVTQKIKFILKPKANYTDQARTNQIQGTVRLRVTFSASGQIGSISPVSGLPYGLTEQAIAAARQIRFEPAKKNGIAVPYTAVVEYNFNIY